MFSALLKAFTGRAGLLAGLLALALVVVTVAAVYMKTPEIEQSLSDRALPVLHAQLGEQDELISFRAEGRNLMLEGRFDDPGALAIQLLGVEGVRSVFVNGADLGSGAEPATETGMLSSDETESGSDESAPSEEMSEAPTEPAEEVAEVSVSDQSSLEAAPSEGGAAVAESELQVAESNAEKPAEAASAEPQAVAGDAAAAAEERGAGAPETAAAATEGGLAESSLSLRYDGTRLRLSGQMGDEQMAQLVTDSVRRAIPRYSELEAEVGSEGKPSPLNWMRQFLAAVARLPDDAQGVIVGSDSEGVAIIPDPEQTLVSSGDSDAADTSVVESGPASEPEAVEPGPADGAGSDVEPEVTESEPDTMAGADATQPELAGPEAGVEPAAPAAGGEAMDSPVPVHPGQFIVELNQRLAATPMFATGEYAVGEALAAELDRLAEMLRQHPNLLLRIVGNIDFDANPRIAEFIGLDRARSVRNYLYRQGIDRRRLFAKPLPREHAFEKQVQLVFYISE